MEQVLLQNNYAPRSSKVKQLQRINPQSVRSVRTMPVIRVNEPWVDIITGPQRGLTPALYADLTPCFGHKRKPSLLYVATV